MGFGGRLGSGWRKVGREGIRRLRFDLMAG